MRRTERFLASLLAGALVLLGGDADACGPHFPDQVLTDPNVLSREALWFAWEIERIPRPRLPETEFAAVPYESGDRDDVREIAEALRARGDAPETIEATSRAVTQFRAGLPRPWESGGPVERRRVRRGEQRAVSVPSPPAGLPRVFDLYLRGLAAWRCGDRTASAKAWRALLELPAEERRPRLVWAQYMLGRMEVDDTPASAVTWFAASRESARAGAPDPIGLAAQSARWEARAEMRRGNDVRALTLYHALGDESSVLALLREAFAEAGRVARLASDPLTRRIGTAYVVSGGAAGTYGSVAPEGPRIAQWLAAVEPTGCAGVEDADRLAWIAYESGDFAVARRWLARADAASPVAALVDARLLLHDGRVDEASERLQQVVRNGASGNLSPTGPYGIAEDFATALAADRGALELSRGRFAEALAALLDGRSWIDAAYVAERVLTVDELAAFVAAHCPSADGDEREWAYCGMQHGAPGVVVHGLLARRLAREGRWGEAFPHFAPELRSKAERFALRLAEGRDEARDRDFRANALRDAARILRADGMDLVGTETAPDWRMFGGNYELRDVASQRPSAGIASATPQERERAERCRAQPERRFHYRYLAADIAWDAALLMPDETPTTAAWLREAGMWLAARDPKAADRFHKAMVHRCGTTELGKAAAAAKWFPK